MEKADALTVLAALAQDNRLDVYRLLVQAGPGGMPAGEISDALRLAPNTLTFHFDRLRQAGLVSARREGRSMIYTARPETLNGLIAYLAENCCLSVPGTSTSPIAAKAVSRGGSRTGRAAVRDA